MREASPRKNSHSFQISKIFFPAWRGGWLPLFALMYPDFRHLESVSLNSDIFPKHLYFLSTTSDKEFDPKHITSVEADDSMARNDESPLSNNEKKTDYRTKIYTSLFR
jgi:hypothetical protein